MPYYRVYMYFDDLKTVKNAIMIFEEQHCKEYKKYSHPIEVQAKTYSGASQTQHVMTPL